MRVIGVAGFLALLATLAARAGNAQPPAPWPGLPIPAYGGYYIFVDPRLYRPARLPHFALYPPVYYSLPVPRPYGHSPFAYPPGYVTPQPLPPGVRPVTILNPFVPTKPGETSAEPVNRAAKRGVRIRNPYVAGPVTPPAILSAASQPNLEPHPMGR